MTRILHTSDWHLGATLEGVSREEEHRLFLRWLLEVIQEREVEVLLLAGDIFDHAQPSAEAQGAYYRFLADLRQTDLRAAVVVGGNHDSASRLDAPRQVLDSLDIHVVGGLKADESTWDRCLVPVRGDDGQVLLVVAAVPFVHEHRLGVRASLVDPAELRAAFRERFTYLYKALTDQALELGAGAPVVATGHLSCVGGDVEDAPVEIHLASSTDGLPGEIFDERLAYVALGHFHRSFKVKGGKARYSGTPVPLNARESATPRRVLLVDVDSGGQAAVTRVEVPRARDVLQLSGPAEQVLEQLQALTWETPLPPLVLADLEVEGYQPGLEVRLAREADTGGEGRPILARVKQVRVGGAGDDAGSEEQTPSLTELSTEDVFRRLCAARLQELDEPLLLAFRSLFTEDEAEVSR